MPPFVAYHGLTGQQHQQRVNELAAEGFRPISLSVSGDPGDERYAAVWVQRPGPDWRAVHGLSADAYQAKFNELVGQGYAPMLVSAAGPAASATFTALFERGVTALWFARHGLRWSPETDPNAITHENDRAFKEGFIPRCLAVYGTPNDRRFAGVWIKNDAPTPWSWWFADAGTYQRIFDAENQADVRPAWILSSSRLVAARRVPRRSRGRLVGSARNHRRRVSGGVRRARRRRAHAARRLQAGGGGNARRYRRSLLREKPRCLGAGR